MKMIRVYWFVMDALFGYPKEYSWTPEGPDIKIRHKDGIWTLRPHATYCRRALSPFKTDHRRGWEFIDTPASMVRFKGKANMTEDPGQAISNHLAGEEFMASMNYF
jgi:hypothetical protein